MNVFKITGFTFVLALVACIGGHGQGIKIDITEIVWTDSITKHCTATNNFTDQIPLGPVGLWVKAYCSCHTFKAVQEKGHLPILFKWFKRVGLT